MKRKVRKRKLILSSGAREQFNEPSLNHNKVVKKLLERIRKD